jgi:hypothetical protein
VSITFLTSVSLNRYLHVVHTKLYKRVFTLRQTVVICLTIWVGGFIVVFPPAFGSPSVPGLGSYRYNHAAHFCSFGR